MVGAGAAAEGAAAAGAGTTSSDGLIQQASTRPFKLSGVLGSMVLECRTRQRNAAWIWPLGTAETVVKIEVAESGIEIVAPEQADHAPAEPHAFRIAGRSVNRMLRFGVFVDLLGFFGGILAGWRLLRSGVRVTALRHSRMDEGAYGNDKPGGKT